MISQNLFLLLVGGGCSLSTSPCWPLHTYPHRFVNGPHFEAWTRPQPEITSPNPARARYLFLKPDLGLKAKFTEGVQICATATENAVCSGDSRMKKLGRHCGDKEKSRGANIKCLSCMVIFRCNEDWFAVIKPIKPRIGFWISSEPSPGSFQTV